MIIEYMRCGKPIEVDAPGWIEVSPGVFDCGAPEFVEHYNATCTSS